MQQAPKRTVTDFHLTDATGQVHTRKDWDGNRGILLFFIATECPAANGYAPDMARIAAENRDQGILTLGVHSDPDITAELAREHAREYSLGFPGSTQVADPIGLVPMVKEMDELRPARQTKRPPRACHVGEGDSSANCGNSRKPDNLIHHPDEPDGVSRDLGFMLAHQSYSPSTQGGWGLHGLV